MVWRSLSDTTFSEAKQLLVGCREQLGKKRYRMRSTQKYHTPSKLQNEIKKIIVVLMRKKMFLFKKTDKNIQFNSLFLGNS